jgi:hypothetical protein
MKKSVTDRLERREDHERTVGWRLVSEMLVFD